MTIDQAHFSRAELVARGALGLGALLGFGLTGPLTGKARAARGHQDLDLLDFLLKFEYIEVALYESALNRLRPTGDLKTLIETIGKQEQQHANWLLGRISEVGGKPVPKLSYEYLRRRMPPTTVTPPLFLRLAREIEEAVVAAYNGAIPQVKSRRLRTGLASIVQEEGRHLAAVRLQRNEAPAPEPFDRANNEFDALSSVERFAGPAIYEGPP